MDSERTTNPGNTILALASLKAPEKGEARAGWLVIIYGSDLGRRFALSADQTVIGRSAKSDLQVEQESVSRSHACITKDASHYVIRDLGSTNGTYINDKPVSETALRDGDQIKVGRTIFKFIVSGNTEAQYHEEIYRLMTVDGLTDLHNKRFFDEAVEREASRARRYDRYFSMILFDIDHFKRVNDSHGHLAGDAVLRQLGSLVRSKVRRDDIPARTGGEEFSVIVPEVRLSGASALAEKLRREIETHAFRFEDLVIPITVSLGVAEWEPTNPDVADLVRRADDKLYEAKRAGRNRVCS